MFSHAPVQLDAASETTYLSLVGQTIKINGLDSALSGKQTALPEVTNGYYLHANADTGAIEWAAGGGGSVSWGDIGGTLSDQTDLGTALGAKQDTLPTTEAGYAHWSGSAWEIATPSAGGVPGITSTNYATYPNTLDMSSGSGGAQILFNVGGCLLYLLGNPDGNLFYQMRPSVSTAWVTLEGSQGAGFAVSTEGDHPIQFTPNRTVQLEASSSGVTVSNGILKLPSMPTSDPGDGVSLWCDAANGNVVKLSVLTT